ncbi:MAG: solute carrier family 23 protein, partial [Rhodospirillaceae bacterium]
LAVIVVASVWSKGSMRTFSVLLGIVCGYIVAAATGQLDVEALAQVWFGSPLNIPKMATHLPQFSFSLSLLLPFIIGALACSLRTIGDVTTAQKINDANWRRPDIFTIEGGILACGLGNILAGFLGSIGSNTSSSGVGLSGATGVTSRRVGYAMAGLMAFLSFVPGLAMLLAVMPRPVLGAVMLFTGCLVIMNGLAMIMSRVIDMRKTMVVGVSMVLGIGHDIFPELFQSAPTWMQPFVESSVVLSILAALLLNGLFRLGVKKSVATGFVPGPEAAEQMYRFLQTQGGAWAARQDVIQRAIRGVSEFAEISTMLVEEGGGVSVTASFDEYLLTVEIGYSGRAFEVSRVMPTEDELLEDEEAMIRLASILMARSADRVSVKSDEGGHRVLLSFNH